MIYVFFQYWIFIALALVLGLFVGWATCTGHDHNQRSNWLAWAVAAFLAGLFLAGFKWIPGLLGHLLEVALMLFAAYIIGCITGCGARSVAGGDDGGHGHGHGHDNGHGGGHGPDHGASGAHGSGAHASAPQSASATAAGVNATADVASPASGSAQAAASHAPPAAETPPPATAEAAAAPPVSASSPTDATTAGEAAASSAVLSEAPSGAPAPSAAASDAKASARTVSTTSDASASLDAPVAPRTTMTDGRRSILAAKEKLALQRQKAAAASASSIVETVQPASAPPAPVAPRAALVDAAALAPRAAMTDGQRSILAARQKMAEKAAKAAAVWEAEGVSTSPAPASAAADQAGGARPGADSDPAAPADDLKLIKGVGPKNEAALNGLGVRRFAQIADWSADNEKWVGQSIKFPGRIEREHWVAQAKLLAAGIETPHAAAVKSGAIKVDESADAPLSDDEAKAFVASLPQQAPKVEGESAHAGARPLGLVAPKGGKADDLKRIKGIGRQNEERLHNLGVWHFDQIAAWSVENVKWVGSYLAFPGRIDREQWIAQATSLARGELTEFAKRVDAGDVPTSSKDGRESRLI